jgi:hypothetical protein
MGNARVGKRWGFSNGVDMTIENLQPVVSLVS